MESEVSHGLEKEKRSERFTLIDAPRIPEKPVRPNRKAIILIGVILGLGCGVGVAALRENLDHSVRSTDALAKATGFPVLAGIPVIVTPQDAQRQVWSQRIAIVGVVLVVLTGMLVFHLYVMDLNVFWAKVVRRTSLLL
jgi:hypothetical protein